MSIGRNPTKLSRKQIEQIQKLVKKQSRQKRLTPENYRAALMKNLALRAKNGGKMSVSAAFKELKKNPPKVLGKTAKKYGKKRAEKQKVAIALSKAGKTRPKRA